MNIVAHEMNRRLEDHYLFRRAKFISRETRSDPFKMAEKKKHTPNSIEVIPLSNDKVKLVQKEISNEGKSVTVSDEKFKIIDEPSLSAARESIAAEIIKSTMNLGPHKRIEKIDEAKEE